MPKNRSVRKSATGALIKSRPCSKFRIGSRKSGTSAILMTSEQLKEVLNDKNKSRYHPKAVTVLQNRGITVEWPGSLAKVETGNDGNMTMEANTSA